MLSTRMVRFLACFTEGSTTMRRVINAKKTAIYAKLPTESEKCGRINLK